MKPEYLAGFVIAAADRFHEAASRQQADNRFLFRKYRLCVAKMQALRFSGFLQLRVFAL